MRIAKVVGSQRWLGSLKTKLSIRTHTSTLYNNHNKKMPHNQITFTLYTCIPSPPLTIKTIPEIQKDFCNYQTSFCIKTEKSQITSTPNWNEWSWDPFYQSVACLLACLSDQKLYPLSNTNYVNIDSKYIQCTLEKVFCKCSGLMQDHPPKKSQKASFKCYFLHSKDFKFIHCSPSPYSVQSANPRQIS
jgi:hypothetical protein